MNRKTIHIKKGKGKRSKEFRFTLVASNGKDLSDREFYKNKKDVVDLAKKNFPDFEIVDDTISKPNVIYQK